MDEAGIAQFIERWEASGAAERANYQLFLSELCDVIGVPHPEPATSDTTRNAYVFERAVDFHDGQGGQTTRFIDLYKRGCFVLEAKQGSAPDIAAGESLSEAQKKLRAKIRRGTARRGTPAWDQAMLRAKGQADQYVRALSRDEGRPPFIVVADVGHTIELYAEFSCTGGTYVPFPAPGSHRIFLHDLERPDIRERLHAVWTDPHGLDPSRRSARVTRDIADRLAKLAKSLEQAGHAPRDTAAFLMRCLFTMFAEDVWLLPKGAFTRLLESLRDTPEHFVPMVEELWSKMNGGGFSTSLRAPVLRFNGGLFAESAALPLNRDQLMLLIEAAQCDWRDVEPAIFGTLLERALDPLERHKLGAHYTPRAYVERLVVPAIVQPLRAEWEAVQAAIVKLTSQDKTKEAVREIRGFHRRLCEVRILDPACGSGNFLYVTLEHLKRIEGELFDTLDSLGEKQGVLEMLGHVVDPHQLLGLEVNPRAAAIAELVLWIGTLQWHYRNRGAVQQPRQPIIRDFHNIECRDALIEWDAAEPLLDDDGAPVTRWDGRTTKPHPVTGREVPDESARAPVQRYLNPRRAAWPDADFIIGNPPFIGASHMREYLGDGYTEAVRAAHPDMSESSDFVMYWWNHAAELVRAGRARRFGFVTTNSLRQKFNRRTLEWHLTGTNAKGQPSHPPLALGFAIPDHPWVDASDGAAVRIAMTVGIPGPNEGTLATVARETADNSDHYDVHLQSRTGILNPDLTLGADVASAVPLKANEWLACEGVKPHGMGFVLTPEEARQLGLGRVPGLEQHIRPYRNGRDITGSPRGAMIIDLFGLGVEEVRDRYPEVYQWVSERVKPERDHNNRKSYRENWWTFGEPRSAFRPALQGLSRYIATVKTAKHRLFLFLDSDVLWDSKLIAIASEDAFHLGVLSSYSHLLWSEAAGGHLGVGNDPTYVIHDSFKKFPFPAASEEQKERIRGIAERLDAHRRERQALHPKLKLTDMYNVLEKLRATDAVSPSRQRPASAPETASGDRPEAVSGALPVGSGEGAPLPGAGTGVQNPGGGPGAAPPPAPPAFTDKDRRIHDQGLITVLRDLHDELDAAVADAYGWPADLPDDELLDRLVRLNAERAAEEEQGLVRWLRPDYQRPKAGLREAKLALDLPASADTATTAPAKSAPKQPWPKTTAERIQAVRTLVATSPEPLTAKQIAARFTRARTPDVEDLLAALALLGHLHPTNDNRYSA